MPSRGAAGGLLLGALALVAGSAGAQPLTDAACVRLLGGDDETTPLAEAAATNLDAAALKAPDAADRRAASTGVLDSSVGRAALDVDRLCSRLTAERAHSSVLLTGYYRPIVPARRSREGNFQHPLYALPNPALRDRTRAEIDQGALDGKVPAVAWLADPIEVFFIHVQGSAVLEMPDGRMAVGYAGSNGRPYTSIGALLVRDGLMSREDVTMESLKAYLRDHPAGRDAILRANERYIYFRPVANAALGSLGVPLTDGRSVAADPGAYPPGALLFLDSVPGSTGVSPRLVFVQDRGSAITGPARLDLYVGTGDEAAVVAGPLRQQVDVYILRPK